MCRFHRHVFNRFTVMRDSLRSESLCLSETKDGKPVFLTRFNLLTKVSLFFFLLKRVTLLIVNVTFGLSVRMRVKICREL